MPTITANTTDGYQASGLKPTWDDVHDAVSPQSVNATSAGGTVWGIRVEYASARSKYYLVRTFFDWDVSGISGTVSAASINVKTHTNNDCSPGIVLKSGHDPSDTSTAWNSTWLTGLGGTISGWGPSSTGVTTFSAATATAANGSFTSFTLNAAGLSHLNSVVGTSNLFKVVIMDNDHDLQDSAPSGLERTGYYYANDSTAGNRPYLDYTISTGYGEDVIGVASANIGKVVGVATANVGKVSGV